MKAPHYALAWLAMAAPLFSADEKPALPIDKALAIAQQHLKDAGHAGDTAIVSLAIERAALGSSKVHWYAKWSPPFPLDGGRKALGLEIAMDGTATRIVDKKAPK
jgi:hypothetical protein